MKRERRKDESAVTLCVYTLIYLCIIGTCLLFTKNALLTFSGNTLTDFRKNTKNKKEKNSKFSSPFEKRSILNFKSIGIRFDQIQLDFH